MKYLKIVSNRHSISLYYIKLDDNSASARRLFDEFCKSCEIGEEQDRASRIANIRKRLHEKYEGILRQDPLYADLAALFAEWLVIEKHGSAVEGEEILGDRTATVEEFLFPL